MKKFFIGVDFAKEKFDVALIHADGFEELEERQYATFENTTKGYNSLMKWLKANNAENIDSLLFCGEDTGSCSIGLSNWLYGKGYCIWIENAYAIKHSSGLHRIKTDKADASMIAEYAWRHQDKATYYEPLSASLAALREVFLYRHQLVQQRASMDVRKQEKSSLEQTQALNFINEQSKHLMEELRTSIEKCDKQIDELIASDAELQKNYNIITSIKGVARQNATCLIIYTNNFKRFNHNARKLACYYGIAPFGKESGTSVHTPAHTSHLANKLIKALLNQAATTAIRYEPEMQAYYARLIARGKKHLVALNNVMNKLLRIIIALVREGNQYDPAMYAAKREQLKQRFLAPASEKLSIPLG